MLPHIVDSVKINEMTVVSFDNGCLCVGFEIAISDIESNSALDIKQVIQSYLSDLDSRIRVRLILNSQAQNDLHDHSRKEAISEIGFVENRLFVFFEKDLPIFDISSLLRCFKHRSLLKEEADKFLTHIPLELLKALGGTFIPLDLDQYKKFLPNLTEAITLDSGCILLGTDSISVLKLVKQSTHPISISTFAQLKDTLDLPYQYIVTIESKAAHEAERDLRQKSNQAESGSDKVSSDSYHKLQDTMTKVVSGGARFLNIECQLLLARNSVGEAKIAAKNSINKLRPFAGFYLETIGTEFAWKASLLGQTQHYPFLELDEVTPCYLPLFTYGESPLLLKLQKSSLVLHRKDESLGATGPFQEGYDSFSSCIIGLPGSGKSVLGNMLTRALYFDPQVNIVKIDVGGSHSRETSILGGIEYEFTIDKPGGFNPFSILTKTHPTKELAQILTTFLETLLKEENETFISKDLKADIENSLLYYFENRSQNPEIDDYLKIAGSRIPRAKLLERWSSKGVYGNAFKELNDSDTPNNRLKYFNFSKISQALDGDFAQGGLASVMVAFNFDILFNRQGRRFVFIADEVPIFVQRCFSFFDLSIANIRKYGDGFITIGQKTEHFIVGEKSLLSASPSKYLFSADTDDQTLLKRLQIGDRELKEIKQLQRVQGKHSEVFHIDNLGHRTFRIVLSPKEYWSYTSKKEDKDRLARIMDAVPGLSVTEAIRCLSHS